MHSLQHKAHLLESEMAVRKQVETDLRSKVAELAECRPAQERISRDARARAAQSALCRRSTPSPPRTSTSRTAIAPSTSRAARPRSSRAWWTTCSMSRASRKDESRCARSRSAVGDIVEQAVEENRAAAEARQQRLVVIAPPDTRDDSSRCRIPARMQQVISNLIQNASKFTPARGRIEVS